jgi:polysaccharide biosynthesis protein PslG
MIRFHWFSRAAAALAWLASRAVPRLLSIAALAVLAALAAAPVAPAKAAPVPASFVGVVGDGPLFEGYVNLENEMDQMVGAGVQSFRVVVDWSEAQPYAKASDVPPDQAARFRDEGGVPTDYSLIDRVVEGAVTRRISILPVILIAPDWAARHPGNFNSPPKGTAAYSNFAGALARRYGPSGSFWAERPDLPRIPVRYWQFWNEPSLEFFWSDRPWEKAYVALVRAARTQVRKVDSGARIVLAGLPNKSWPELEKVYKLKARNLFDVVAIHPFTKYVSGTLEILRRNREVMRRYGDRKKPMMVTELSWTSARGKAAWTYGNETTEPGQAKKLRQAFELLAAHRSELRLQRIYWYSWLTFDQHKNYPFDYAGLSRLDGEGIHRKPAFEALKRTALELEGCTTKSGTADRCAS